MLDRRRVPIVRGAKPRPIIELDWEHESRLVAPKNGESAERARKKNLPERRKSLLTRLSDLLR